MFRVLRYSLLTFLFSLVMISCDLSPDILCQRNQTCKEHHSSLGCFKGHCLPEWWIKDAKKLIEKNNQCRFCPAESESCIDIIKNDMHCGNCNEQCQAKQQCQDAWCRCAAGLVLCAHGCTYLQSHPEHCGKCAFKCQENEYCSRGQCTQLSCEKQNPPLSTCGRACIDLKTNPVHCGACNKRCKPDEYCIGGICRCGRGQKVCDGFCTDSRVDRKHCGGCGQPCSKGKVCANGKCLTDCPPLTPDVCFGGCFDLKTSTRHCGKCGNRCMFGLDCVKGRCRKQESAVEVDPEVVKETLDDSVDASEFPQESEAISESKEKEALEPNCKPTNGGKEICDGLDNDCNNQIDDLPSKDCYTGSNGTLGFGPCKKGKQSCNSGRWGKCTGEILPKMESCNNIDDNCDGKIDEGINKACYSGKPIEIKRGPCKRGTQICAKGKWGKCIGETLPQKEVCNNIDDNCDGKIDEGLTKKCYTGPNSSAPGLGICKAGLSTCIAGKWGTCTGEITPQKEACDGKDNDCNGIEDSFARGCYGGPPNTKDKGLCKGGSQTCATGKWSPCNGQVLPKTEICNNQDDDCDGLTDEKLTKNCFTGPGTIGKGICKSGVSTCKSGKWGICTGQSVAQTEKCDTIDNDCDGKTDEGCSCVSGRTRACGKFTQGNCKQGKQSCIAGKWGACSGEILPRTESCDNKDNDCDGKIDESLSKPCYTGPTGTLGKGRCKVGSSVCKAGKWGKCVGAVIPSSIELCNGTDDDCDGQIDEVPANPPNCTKSLGVCKGLKKRCIKGTWKDCDLSDYQQYSRIYQAKEIRCDNKDNDCDGKIDHFSVSCYTDFFTKPRIGVCKAGLRTCTNGSFGICVGQILPSVEKCNEKDDDCDGKIDEGCVVTLAGSVKGYKNGKGSIAQFNIPSGLVFDQLENLYILDTDNHIIRKVDTRGNVTVFAGIPKTPGVKSGQASQAQFNEPYGIAIDKIGNFYITEAKNHVIRKIDRKGIVTIFAGTLGKSGYSDGLGTGSMFSRPTDLVIDIKGNLYVADGGNRVIRMVTPAGKVSTYAGVAGVSGTRDGFRTTAQFRGPSQLAISRFGTLYVSDTPSHTIRRISSGGIVETIAGLPGKSGSRNGKGKQARFYYPQGLSVDSLNNVYISDTGNNLIRKIDKAGNVTTYSGTGYIGTKDGAKSKALFSGPSYIKLNKKGDIYISDTGNHRIRRIIVE